MCRLLASTFETLYLGILYPQWQWIIWIYSKIFGPLQPCENSQKNTDLPQDVADKSVSQTPQGHGCGGQEPIPTLPDDKSSSRSRLTSKLNSGKWVVFACFDGVRPGLNRLLRCWRDRKRIIQDVHDRALKYSGTGVAVLMNTLRNMVANILWAIKVLEAWVFWAIKVLETWVFRAIKVLETRVFWAIKVLETWVFWAIKVLENWVFWAIKVLKTWIFWAIKVLVTWVFWAIKVLVTWIFWAIKVLVTWVFRVVERVVFACFDGIKRGLNRVLHCWRDEERIIQEVHDRDVSQEKAEKLVYESAGEYHNLPKLPDLDVSQKVAEKFVCESAGEYHNLHNLPDLDLPQESTDKSVSRTLQGHEYCRQEPTLTLSDDKSSCCSRIASKLNSGRLELQDYGTTLWNMVSLKMLAVILRREFKTLLVTLVLWVFLQVVFACYDGVRRGLNHMLRCWRDKERVIQEVHDRDVSQEVAEKFVCESSGEYHNLHKLPDLGSRLQKYWYRATTGDNAEVIITVIKVSTRCAVDLVKDIKTINKKLLPEIQGLYLQPVLEVKYYGEEDQLVMVQPFHELGSLKDFIYQKPPTKDWSQKYYTFSRNPPPTHLIAKYGRQILKGVLKLYELGFDQVGHIQSGNIYLDGDSCLVGGYENTVFGYKTRLTTLLHDYKEAMDLIMFGHVIFELACGYELTTVVPVEEDWSRVRDDAVMSVLQFIFHTDGKGRFTATIEKVLRHEFFSSVEGLPGVRRPRLPHVTNRGMKTVLSKVNKGVWSEERSKRCKVQ